MKPDNYEPHGHSPDACDLFRKVFLSVVMMAFAASNLDAAPRTPGPPWPEIHLYLERFDEAYQLPADQIDSSVFVPSWSGYALTRQPGAALTPWTVPMVGPGGSWQVPPRAGAVRLWFMPSFTSASLGGNGPANPATLLTLVTTNGDASLTWWSLVISADGNSIQLQCPSANSDAPCLTAPVNFQFGGWTLLTFGWTPTNTAVWWNDQLIGTGAGIPAMSAQAAPLTSLVVGSDICGQNPATGLIDLLTTFSGDSRPRRPPPTPFGLDPAFNLTAYGNSLAATTVLGPVSDAPQMRMSGRMTMMSSDTTDNSLFPIFNTNNLPQPKPYRPTSTNGLQQVFSWPTLGTFWSLQRTNMPPLPLNPCATCNVFVYDATNNIYLVDDTGYSYPVSTNTYEPAPLDLTNSFAPGTLYLTIAATNAGYVSVLLHGTTNGASYTLQSTEDLSGSNLNWLVEQDVLGADGVTAVQVPLFGRRQLFFQAHTGTDAGPRVLFVQIAGVAGGSVALNVYSTAAGQTYDIETEQNLNDAAWTSQGTFTGLTNWTQTTVSAAGATRFMRARCWMDSTGSGVPDWWADLYGGETGFDPYAYCPSNHYTLIDAYQKGINPLAWFAPPGPTGWAYIDPSGPSRVIQWEPALGATQYQLVKCQYYFDDFIGWWLTEPVSTQTVSSATLTLIDNAPAPLDQNPDINPDGYWDEYLLYALYPQGASQSTLITDQTQNLDMSLIHGPNGTMQLALFAAPKGTVGVRLILTTNNACGWGLGANQSFDIPLSSFTNNMYQIPDQQYPLYTSYIVAAQAITPTGFAGMPNVIEADCAKSIRYPFLNASRVLKDNLVFTLQSQPAIGTNSPANAEILYQTEGVGLPPASVWNSSVVIWPPRYACASYRTSSDPSRPYPSWSDVAYPFHPWEVNATLKNYEYQTASPYCWYASITDDPTISDWPFVRNISCCEANFTSAGISGEYYFDSSGFASGGNSNACASELSNAAGRIVMQFDPFSPVSDDGTTSTVATVHPNAYGLPFQGVLMETQATTENDTNRFDLIAPGGSWLDNNWPGRSFQGERFAAPSLQKDIYQFTTGGNLDSLSPYFLDTGGMPITPLLVAAVGDWDFSVSAWLRYKLLNGAPGMYGYVEQYFDKAYKMDTNGNPTAAQTGVLSPYGYFFPTEPGDIALTTTTNIEDGGQGVGVVHVISLSTDANRDGVIDPTFSGPDFVSPIHPFRFWINDGTDAGDDTGDGIPGQTKKPNALDGQVNGSRDLVNFFPVWVNAQNLLRALPNDGSITVWLKQEDEALNYVDTTWTSDPPFGPTNCLAYLTNLTIAEGIGRPAGVQSAPTYQISSFGEVMDGRFVSRIRDQGDAIVLVEARKITSKPLVLEVHQWSNVVATAKLYLNITGVEQMFRHKNLVHETFPSASSAGAPADRLNDADVPNEPDTNGKNFVFVHGYNVLPDEARGNFADVFKRMYWAGSHATFYGVTWGGASSKGTFPFYNKLTPNYHTNVANAFLTATNLASFIVTLTNSGPVTLAAHSLGNMVTLSAISDWNAPIGQYFMLDAAVPIEAIDPAATTNMMIYSTWLNYTNRLYASDWSRLFPDGDARATLSWNNRLGNLRDVDVYNFYSSGEEVLRTTSYDPPSEVLNKLATQARYHFWDGYPFGSFTWYWQEKGKGTCSQDWFLGSSHGGWKFNDWGYGTNSILNPTFWVHMSAANAALLSTNQLQTNAFFDLTTSLTDHAADLALQGPNGSNYAQANRNRILADAIPAMSLVAGANPVPRLAPFGQPNKNIDMMTFENGWPQSRTGTEANMWHHSDYHDVAYTFTYKLFNQFVTTGNLK